MLPRAGNFHPALGPLLPNDIGKIHIAPGRAGRCFQFLPVQLRIPDEKVRRVFFLLQDAEYVVQRAHTEEVHAGVVHSLERRLLGQDAAAEPLPDGQFHHGKRAVHGADTAVQSQFSHDQVFVQRPQIPLGRCSNNAQGNGEVVAAALLVEVGRGQVNDYLLAGNVEPPGLQRRHRAQEAFLDGGIGKTDQMDSHAKRDVHFHSYGNGVYSHAFGAMNVYEHKLIRCRFQ